MYARTFKGNGFTGCITYVLKDREAKILTGTMTANNYSEIASEFSASRRLNSRSTKLLAHTTLAFHKDDPLTENQLIEIAERYMKKMGYENTQWVAVQHFDTVHTHMHIVASRVDMKTRKLVSDSNERYRSRRLCQAIEQDYGLINTPDAHKGKTKDEQPETALKIGQEVEAIHKETLDTIKAQSDSLKDFIEQCESNDIKVIPNVSPSTQNFFGLSFVIEGQRFKASQISKDYSKNGLKQSGFEYDKADFEYYEMLKNRRIEATDYQKSQFAEAFEIEQYKDKNGQLRTLHSPSDGQYLKNGIEVLTNNNQLYLSNLSERDLHKLKKADRQVAFTKFNRRSRKYSALIRMPKKHYKEGELEAEIATQIVNAIFQRSYIYDPNTIRLNPTYMRNIEQIKQAELVLDRKNNPKKSMELTL